MDLYPTFLADAKEMLNEFGIPIVCAMWPVATIKAVTPTVGRGS